MPTTTANPRVYYPGQSIQWHLKHSGRDRCPTCRGPLGFLKTRERACFGTCVGRVWKLRGTVRGWRARLAAIGEPTAPLRGRRR